MHEQSLFEMLQLDFEFTRRIKKAVNWQADEVGKVGWERV